MHMIYEMEKVQQKPSHSFDLGFCFSFAKCVVKFLIFFWVNGLPPGLFSDIYLQLDVFIFFYIHCNDCYFTAL